MFYQIERFKAKNKNLFLSPNLNIEVNVGK